MTVPFWHVHNTSVGHDHGLAQNSMHRMQQHWFSHSIQRKIRCRRLPLDFECVQLTLVLARRRQDSCDPRKWTQVGILKSVSAENRCGARIVDNPWTELAPRCDLSLGLRICEGSVEEERLIRSDFG